MGPGAFAGGGVDGGVCGELLALLDDGVEAFEAFEAGGAVGHGHGLDADDVPGVEGLDGFEVLALLAELDEFLAEGESGGVRGGGE